MLHMTCTLDTPCTTGILSQNKKNIHVQPLAYLKNSSQKITKYQFSWISGTIYFKSPGYHMEVIHSL